MCGQLIAARAKVDLEDRFKMTPLDLALEAGSELVVDLLLRSAADPNRGNLCRGLQQTSLHQASDRGNEEFIKLLLKHRGNANLAGKQGMTPLHLAARKKHIEAVQVLLNSGAEVSLLDKSGFTPGHYAVSNGSSDLADALSMADDVQLCDRIAILEKAKTELSRKQAERRAILETINAF